MRRSSRAIASLAPALAVAAAVAAGCAARGTAAPGYDAQPDASGDGPGPTVDAGFGVPEEAGGLLRSGCATARAPIQRDPIYMLMVLDGSGSMADDNKWRAIVPALEAFVDDLAARKDTSFGLGLTVFSDTLDTTRGAGPYDSVDVPIGYVDDAHAVALHARLDLAKPLGQTPTFAVLSGQYAQLEKYTPQAPLQTGRGHKVLVLLTDGVPTPDATTQQDKCIQAAKNEFALTAPAGPITTVAVGIGHTFPLDQQVYDPLFMAQLALAGGAPKEPCAPYEIRFESNMCHFQITPLASADPTQLRLAMSIAFDKIRARVTSCELLLDQKGLVDPALVNVVFTDAHNTEHVLNQDPVDGWTYDDPGAPTKVVLHGKSCANLQANPSGDVEVVVGCKTLVR